IRPMIRHHHERWDGNGYPDGLKGEEIPLGSRIIAVVDVFDALTSDRPYRRALDVDKAIGMIKREMEGYFDPNIARKFLRMFEELEYPLLHRKSPHHEG
ncbi:MAG: HD-GYP domain-containing protein, partial [Thermotoga sp.]